jgi:hypothetical protein
MTAGGGLGILTAGRSVGGPGAGSAASAIGLGLTVAGIPVAPLVILGGSIILKWLFGKPKPPYRKLDVTYAEYGAPLPVVYGTAKCPTHRVFATTSGDGVQLWQVLAVCHGEVEDVTELYLDGQLVWRKAAIGNGANGWMNGSGFFLSIALVSGTTYRFQTFYPHRLINGDRVIFSGSLLDASINGEVVTVTNVASTTFDVDFGRSVTAGTKNTFAGQWAHAQAQNGAKWGAYYDAGKVALYVHLGSDSQTHDTNLAAVTTKWTSAHDGRGICYLVLRTDADQDYFSGGVPEVAVTVKGRKVYDIQAAATQYSADPASCIRDYLLSTRYGLGLATTELDEASFLAMSQYYDDAVPLTQGGTVTRYTLHGLVDTGESIAANLERMLSSCRGALAYQAGQYRLFTTRDITGAQQTDVALTADDVLGDLEVRLPRLEDLVNVLRVTWIDPGAGYVASDFEWPREGVSNGYKTTQDNGREVKKELGLPFTTTKAQAEHIASILRHETRSGIVVTGLFSQQALMLTVGDVVNLTHEAYGWVAKKFWVMGTTPDPLFGCQLLLVEFTPAAYSHDPTVNADALPDTNLPAPGLVRGVENLQIVSGFGTPKVHLQWSASLDPYLARYEVQVRRSDQAWLAVALVDPTGQKLEVPGPDDGETWYARVRAVNVYSYTSVWTETSAVVDVAPVAEFTVAIVTEADGIWYTVTPGSGFEYCELYTRLGTASPGTALPEESQEFFVGFLQRTGQLAKRIATPNTFYRRTLFVGYDLNGRRGQVRDFDTAAGTSGAGPTAAPTTLAQDNGNTTAYQIALTWSNNGDAVSETRIFVSGVLRRTYAAGVTAGVVPASPDLDPNTAYTILIDHYRNGQASTSVSASMSTKQFTLDTPTDFDAYGSQCAQEDDPQVSCQWVKGANAQNAQYVLERADDGGFTTNVVTILTTAAGAANAIATDLSSGTKYFRVKATQTGFVDSAWSGVEAATYNACEPSGW